MRSRPFYLVLADSRRGFVARRVTQGPPALEPGELAVRLALEVPDELVRRPTLVVEVPEDAQSVLAVAVELEDTPA